MTNYAINGLGRMGKLALRPLLECGATVSLLNDAIGSPETHAHLLEFDSIHGRWPADISADMSNIKIGETSIPVTNYRSISELPLKGIDIVIDCTGAFKTEADLEPYFAAGVKKVVVSAPIRAQNVANIVYGVNEHIFDPTKHRIVTAASCTTNCLAPIVQVIHEQIGIKHGSITTIHDVTNTQTIVDRPANDLRRARSALTNLIPTTTGSAKAISLIYPELSGRLNGHAIRVPILNASIVDCVFELSRETSVSEVNGLFKNASEGSLQGILGFETRPLVSSDYTNDVRSVIIDGPSTMVVNGTQLKVYAWYDNEFGYVHRLIDIALMVGRKL